MFLDRGIPSERLDLRGWQPPERVLACYHELDLALDTWPYTGGLTTCEALWMGVPVVTCAGSTFASRHGLTHLTAVGLSEMIAGDLQRYVDLAAALASDQPGLADIRRKLRAQMAASPLCDGARFARDLGMILRNAWRQWGLGPSTATSTP